MAASIDRAATASCGCSTVPVADDASTAPRPVMLGKTLWIKQAGYWNMLASPLKCAATIKDYSVRALSKRITRAKRYCS